MGNISSAETGFGSHPNHKRSRPPSSTLLDAHSTISAGTRNGSVHVDWDTRCTIVWSSNLSTQLGRTQTSNTESLTLPATVADPRQTAIRHKYEWRRLHSTQSTKRHKIFRKPMYFNGEHFHLLRVSHFLWAGLHFCQPCHKCYSP